MKFQERHADVGQETSAGSALFHALLESIEGRYLVCDHEDRVVRAGERFVLDLLSEAPELGIPGASYEDLVRHLASQTVSAPGDPRKTNWIAARIARNGASFERFDQEMEDGRCYEISQTINDEKERTLLWRDITDRKSLERSLKESEEHLRIAMESIEGGFILYDSNEELLTFNDKYVVDLPPASRALYQPGVKFETLMRHRAEVGNIDLGGLTIDEWAEKRLVEFRARNIEYEQKFTNGKHIRVAQYTTSSGGTFMVRYDITAQMELVEKLERSERFLRMAISSIHDGFAMFDAEGRLIFCNQRFGDLHGQRDLSSIQGVSYEELLWKGVEAKVFPNAVGREKRWISKQMEGYRRPNKAGGLTLGGGRFFRFTSARTVNGETVLLLSDITALKNAQTDLVNRNAELAAAIEEFERSREIFIQSEKLAALGTIVAGVAHEMNNPIMGIAGYLDYIKRNVKEDKVISVVLKAESAFQRISNIAKNMMSFAHPSSLNYGPVDVKTAINLTLDLVGGEMKRGGIVVEAELPEKLPKAYGKADQIEQILLNLFLNAKHAMLHSDEKVLRVTAFELPNAVEIRVVDSGVGLDPAIVGRVFDPFFTTKAPGEGTGMGLAVAMQTVKEMDGFLRIGNRSDGNGAEAIVGLKLFEGDA